MVRHEGPPKVGPKIDGTPGIFGGQLEKTSPVVQGFGTGILEVLAGQHLRFARKVSVSLCGDWTSGELSPRSQAAAALRTLAKAGNHEMVSDLVWTSKDRR